MNKRFSHPFLALLSVLSLSACNSKGSAKIGMGAQALPVPDAPSALVLTPPNSTPSFLPNPTITVSGVSSGDRVTLFTDASCSTAVSSETTSGGSSVAVSAAGITVGPHVIYARTKNAYGVNSDCSTVSVPYTRVLCPDDYIEVSGSGSVQNFCVMKYEAKCIDALGANCVSASGAPSATQIADSRSTGAPWVSISQIDSKTACTNLNSIHGLSDKFDLISNAEWMITASNIELNNTNWSGGSHGLGFINRGNSFGPNEICDGSLSNLSTDCVTSGVDPKYKRTHDLNGDIIWDLAGNAAEWIDWGLNIGGPITPSPTLCPTGFSELQDVDTSCPSMNSADYSPVYSGTDDSDSTGLGKFYGGTLGTASRGGQINFDENSGIYSLNLGLSGTPDSYTGFRCVYRP